MATRERLICASDALVERGEGLRFEIGSGPGKRGGFVIRFDGVARAYFNECAHIPVELDWLPGQFYDDARRLLICSTHGAMYEPATGYCVSGPCRGARLRRLEVVERIDSSGFG